MSDKYRHVFVFNPKSNGGETLMLVTEYSDNGDGEPMVEQTLTLNSYCNSASFNLLGAVITPEILQDLALELKGSYIQAKRDMEKSNA